MLCLNDCAKVPILVSVSKSRPIKLTKGTFSKVGSGENNPLYVSIRVSRHDMLSLLNVGPLNDDSHTIK